LTSDRQIARLRQAMFGGPDRGLRARPESKFAENVLYVHFGGTLANDEGCRDVAVAQSAGQQPCHLAFACSERVRRCRRWMRRCCLDQSQGALEAWLHVHVTELVYDDVQLLQRR